MCNEGFVEHTIEIDEEDLKEIIEDYLMRHAEFDSSYEVSH
jgi:hypothetical protein